MSDAPARFLIGGLVVSAFATIGGLFKPTSFAGLFGAAPSVALATLALAILKDGKTLAGTECRSMLNSRLAGVRILKSAEVILADGALDYPDELLKELDYTVCSVHSRFVFGKKEQTERILRACRPRMPDWRTKRA